MKKLLLLAAAASVLGGVGHADEFSRTVDLPTSLDTRADFEKARTTILDAATELCESVEYVGVSSFYKPRLTRECVEDAYANAIAQEPTGLLLAYVEGDFVPPAALAEN
ncbi:MAG: hypothetical protein AAFX03_12090 [Pseudomonadota bacterium]